MGTFKIEIYNKNLAYSPPVQFGGESDEVFKQRYEHWKTWTQYQSLWRIMMVDGEGLTAQHMAVESALFPTIEDGSAELKAAMISASEALRQRIVQKNKLITAQE